MRNQRFNRLMGLWVLGLCLANAQSSANPEVGGDFSSSTGGVYIASTDSRAPTVLNTVRLRCPVAGFLIASADAEFGLLQWSAAPGPGDLEYGITRSTEFDFRNSRVVNADEIRPTYVTRTGAIQRFDQCVAGQLVTYRFVAFRSRDLSEWTYAMLPRMSVIHIRDRY